MERELVGLRMITIGVLLSLVMILRGCIISLAQHTKGMIRINPHMFVLYVRFN